MSDQPHDPPSAESSPPLSPAPKPPGEDDKAVLMGTLKIIGLLVLVTFVMLAVLFGLLAAVCGGW